MNCERRILALYMAERRQLVSYANGILGDQAQAEDVVQEAWVRFSSASSRNAIEEPLGYLYRIVRNLAIDSHRRQAREGSLVTQDVGHPYNQTPDGAPSPEAATAAKDELRRLEEALAELPERTRIAMEMRRFGGCTLKEIGAHLGLSIAQTHHIIAEGIAHCRRRVRPGS